jgi:hypothetical protein
MRSVIILVCTWGLVASYAANGQPTTRPTLDEVGAQHPLRVQFEQHLAEMKQMREEIEVKTRTVRDALQKQTGRPGASPQSVRAAIDTLDAEQLKLEVDKVGLTARRDALADAVSHLSEQAQKRAAATNQELIEHLKSQVKLHEEELERLQQIYRTGAVASSEVSKAQSEVEAAKIELSKEMNSPLKNVPELETLTALNRSLIDASVSLTETVARLDYVTKKLQPLTDAQEMVDRLEQLERARTQIEAELWAMQRGR